MSDTALADRTVWGIHMEWDHGTISPDATEVAIGWANLLNLSALPSSRDEFNAALEGKPFNAADLDAVTAIETAAQTQESIEDYVIKRLNGIKDDDFEQFVAGLLRGMGYYARVTRRSGDGGVDVIAHKDELGFEGVIKVQCKRTVASIGGPLVNQLLGVTEQGEKAL